MKEQTQIQKLIKDCGKNANNKGWIIVWDRISCKNCCDENIRILSIGDTISSLHSELSEMLESYRDNDFEHFKEEIADEFIRLFHLCHDLNIDIEKSILEKMEKNKLRVKNHGRKNL